MSPPQKSQKAAYARTGIFSDVRLACPHGRSRVRGFSETHGGAGDVVAHGAALRHSVILLSNIEDIDSLFHPPCTIYINLFCLGMWLRASPRWAPFLMVSQHGSPKKALAGFFNNSPLHIFLCLCFFHSSCSLISFSDICLKH